MQKSKEISQPFKIKNPFWQIRLFFVVCLRNRRSEMRLSFSPVFFLSTKCKARRKGGKDRLLQNSCQINGIKAVLKLHFIFSTRKVNCLGLKTFWLLLKVPCCIVNWHFWQRSKPITFDSSTPHSSGETSKYKDFGSMWTI